ncbi:MAG: hypothetical protein K2K06_01030 [Oscillospiraceae bacterium]|nr:hypothetical protein [Oscillospiraceae bacterium]
MNSLISKLRVCGISVELKKVRGILTNGEHDTQVKHGFIIHNMTDYI